MGGIACGRDYPLTPDEPTAAHRFFFKNMNETKTETPAAVAARARVIPPWLVCIDVETTGLDPARHGLLSIGAFHPATGAQFYVECMPGVLAEVDAEAMRVNGQNIEEARARGIAPGDAVSMLCDWLRKISGKTSCAKFVLAGKNPSFDRLWISRYRVLVTDGADGGYECADYLLSRRMIDVHAVALAVAAARGLDAPAMMIDAVYEALGLPVEPLPHNAFRGALFAWKALEALWEATGAGNLKAERTQCHE